MFSRNTDLDRYEVVPESKLPPGTRYQGNQRPTKDESASARGTTVLMYSPGPSLPTLTETDMAELAPAYPDGPQGATFSGRFTRAARKEIDSFKKLTGQSSDGYQISALRTEQWQEIRESAATLVEATRAVRDKPNDPQIETLKSLQHTARRNLRRLRYDWYKPEGINDRGNPPSRRWIEAYCDAIESFPDPIKDINEKVNTRTQAFYDNAHIGRRSVNVTEVGADTD
jgi:hypothetical protein